ncbi:hypothetical protein BDZ89DRAFT_1068999 [Hymenopellis radicata]|nr:hypothetical protein BDZ89DRAFT_1068999 [Hymenopellis radicata]
MDIDSSHVSVHLDVLSILPIELLTQIFKQYMLLYRSDIASQRFCTARQLLLVFRRSPYALMQVCTLWRDIVKREPCLWSIIPIIIPQGVPSPPEMIHQKAAEFVRRLEVRVARARELPLSLILHDQGDLELSQQPHVYQRISSLFPRCRSICIFTVVSEWQPNSHTRASASWASFADFLRPYPELLELQIGMQIPDDWLRMHDNVQPLGFPAGLQQWMARLITNAPNLLSLQFTHCILNNMRDGPSTLEDLVVPDVRLRIEDLVRMLKHYPRLRGLSLEAIRQGYYITPFAHHELTHLILSGNESGRPMDDEVLNGLSLPALVDFRIVQGLSLGALWPTHPTLDFLSRSRCKLVSYHVQLQHLSERSGALSFDAVRWRELLRMQPSLVHFHVLRSGGTATMVSNMAIDALATLAGPVCPALEDISLPISPSQLPAIQDILEFRSGGRGGVAKLTACNLDIRGHDPADHIRNHLAYFEARQFPVSVTRDGVSTVLSTRA